MPYTLPFERTIALLLALAVVSFTISVLLPKPVAAEDVSNFSDTLSDSDIGAVSNHRISYETTNGVSAGQSFTITFEAGFSIPNPFATTSINFYDDGGFNQFLSFGSPAAGEWQVATTTTTITFTAGSGQSIASSSLVTIYLGTNATSSGTATGTHQISNPGAGGSYKVDLSSPIDAGQTSVAILDDIVVSATVDPSFTFTIDGVANNQTINADAGTSTAITTTATAISYGDLLVDVEHLAAQQLSVTSNASNGFAVTVYQDQNLTAESGGDIDLFADGGEDATPIPWAAPSGSPADEATYGHFGLTSEDADLNGNEFGDALYAGDFSSTSPRTVLHHTGPADGTTANIGRTRVGYKIEITSLQQAGAYTNTLTYIATPVF